MLLFSQKLLNDMKEYIDIHLRNGENFIKLGQALKLSGLAASGVEAKEYILDGLCLVNGEVDTRRGKKLVQGDEVEFQDNVIRICE